MAHRTGNYWRVWDNDIRLVLDKASHWVGDRGPFYSKNVAIPPLSIADVPVVGSGQFLDSDAGVFIRK